MPHEMRKNGCLISDDPARLDFNVIHAFLTTGYWSPGISMELVRRAASNSIAFGVYLESDLAQIGYARVVTDRATFAYLADVFILEPYRGKGHADDLMHAINAHPDLQGLRRWMLMTRDAHALYARHGFTPLRDPTRAMERHAATTFTPPAAR
ncbi:MAG: GNAT family N-acetyltransferase [Phycisphaerae bacterium]|nr:GNAT family N-acetyltransferase [Phycisphaerae bacterium]